MRVLILGGTGMLGHKLVQVASVDLDVFATVRRGEELLDDLGIRPHSVIGGVAATDFDTVVRAIGTSRPDAVVNCIGIVKQTDAAKDPIPSIEVNALFPHRLAAACAAEGARLIQISTDCVFSGREGGYSEESEPDPQDLYGRTKLLGEVTTGALTIRTSMIGRELSTTHGLLEWFLSQQGRTVSGFRRAIFSGLTTLSLSELIVRLLTEAPMLEGLFHVAAAPIAKYELLELIRDVYGLEIEIEPEDGFLCDRSLNGLRFRNAAGFQPLDWRTMIERMHDDPTPYDARRLAVAHR